MINPNLAPAGGSGRSIIVDPHGRVLQQAGTHEEVMIEMLDLDLVHQTRQLGSFGLNQHLKQLRDFEGDFPVYSQGIRHGRLFDNLGPLELVRKLTL
jgi:formamidase